MRFVPQHILCFDILKPNIKENIQKLYIFSFPRAAWECGLRRAAPRVTINLEAGLNPCLVSGAGILPMPVIHASSFYWAQCAWTAFPRSAWERGCGAKKEGIALKLVGQGLSPSALRRESQPLLKNRNQPGNTRIIPGAGIPPMFSLINISPLHRILMDILQFLPKHLFVLD